MNVRNLFIFASALTLPASLAAQGNDTTHLSDLTVTATRVPTAPAELSASTTVLRGDDLRARGVQLVLDALREVPGVMIVQVGSYGAQTSLFMRGGESNYVKVLLDGIPLNQPGGSINFANLTTVDLDRIEVVRGASSVLYGADAMTGVVQLFSRKGSARQIGEVAGRAGTFGTSDFNGNLSFVGNSGFSVSATGTREASDGIYEFNNAYRNSVGTARIGIDRGSAGSGAFTVRYGNSLAHFPTDGGGNVVDHNQFGQEKSLALGLDAGFGVSKDANLQLHGFASRSQTSSTNRSDSPADTNGFAYVDDRAGLTWRKGFDVRYDHHVRGSILSLGAGLEHESDAEHETSLSNFGFGISPDTSALTADRTTRNAYVQLMSEPGTKLTSQLGARVDDNSAFGTFVTWRLGVTLHVTPDTRIWGATGTAFKAPTFSQLFAKGAFEVGNATLLPEKSRNREIGIERSLNHELTVGVAAYWQTFHDLIQFVFAAPGDPTYTNLGETSARGVELTVNARPSPKVTIDGHWSWMHTEVIDTGASSSLSFKEGSTLIRRPAKSGGATISYRVRALSAAVTATRIGDRDDVDFSGAAGQRVILPGYTTVDVGVQLPLRQGGPRAFGLDLTLRGENLFDEKYVQAVGYPGRGRTLFAGGRARF